jgi:hypothetical protein
MKAMFDCGRNTSQRSVGVMRHEGNSVDPRKDDFLKLMMQPSRFFKRDARLDHFVSYDLLREEAIKKARSLNIPQSCFKSSKGWAIWFMRRMGLALQRRMTICQKKCCISNSLDRSEDVIAWEDDVQDEDDSDWVENTDNNSVVSDDGESDE